MSHKERIRKIQKVGYFTGQLTWSLQQVNVKRRKEWVGLF